MLMRAGDHLSIGVRLRSATVLISRDSDARLAARLIALGYWLLGFLGVVVLPIVRDGG